MLQKFQKFFNPKENKNTQQPESFTKRAIRILKSDGYKPVKLSLRIAPHFQDDTRVVIKLPPKYLKEASNLFNDGLDHNLNFILVPISDKSKLLLDALEDNQ